MWRENVTTFCLKSVIRLNVTVRTKLFIYCQYSINGLSFSKINNIISKLFSTNKYAN